MSETLDSGCEPLLITYKRQSVHTNLHYLLINDGGVSDWTVHTHSSKS